MAESEFISNLLQMLTPLGEVRAKPMFGGHGLFLDGTMFALVTRGGALYLKADDINRPDFEARGLEKYGKMPYHATPPEAPDGWSGMEVWAQGAVAASARAKKSKKR